MKQETEKEEENRLKWNERKKGWIEKKQEEEEKVGESEGVILSYEIDFELWLLSLLISYFEYPEKPVFFVTRPHYNPKSPLILDFPHKSSRLRDG